MRVWSAIAGMACSNSWFVLSLRRTSHCPFIPQGVGGGRQGPRSARGPERRQTALARCAGANRDLLWALLAAWQLRSQTCSHVAGTGGPVWTLSRREDFGTPGGDVLYALRLSPRIPDACSARTLYSRAFSALDRAMGSLQL